MNRLLLLMCVLFAVPTFLRGQFSQDACPMNIGFELGNFNNWSCYIGKIDPSGKITVNNSGPTLGRHSILKNAPPFAKDPFGKFPVNCPNGSGYSIQLGNNGINAEAERVSYTFTIPPDENDFIIIYNYAVVFQNPDHQSFEQPKFSAAVFDESTNEPVGCASFEFVASGNLPGFQKSTVGTDVYYKSWSPVTLKLYGYAGKTIRLEFTTNDCTKGGHFGYAYVDVNENCSSLISGNVYCNGAKDVVLTSPAGFMEYHWFNDDFSKELGTGNTLTLSPPPAAGTTYALEIVPYPGLGCLDTLYTTIKHSPEAFDFKVNAASACAETGMDLTLPGVTEGSSPGLKFAYFMDPNQVEFIPQPKYVDKSGVYYIKAVNSAGCNEIKPVTVTIKPPPNLIITDPLPLCYPNTIDLTAPAITAGSDANMKFSYWVFQDTSLALNQPEKINSTGIYFIKGIDPKGCSAVKPVKVSVADYTVSSFSICDQADLTSNNYIANTTTNFQFSYWNDAAATLPVQDPSHVKISKTYYVKATVPNGCSIIKPFDITVNPLPVVSFVPPSPVVYPETVNLRAAVNTVSGYNYSFWKDAAFTQPVSNPSSIDSSGTYFITVKNSAGCMVEFEAAVVINPPAFPKVNAPNIFTPNNDGINDEFRFTVEGAVEVLSFKIYTRSSELVFLTRDITNFWKGSINGKPLPSGTYYWIMEGTDIYRLKKFALTGNITIVR